MHVLFKGGAESSGSSILEGVGSRADILHVLAGEADLASTDRIAHAGAAKPNATLSAKAHVRFWTGYRFEVFPVRTNISWPSPRPYTRSPLGPHDGMMCGAKGRGLQRLKELLDR